MPAPIVVPTKIEIALRKLEVKKFLISKKDKRAKRKKQNYKVKFKD